MQHINLDNNGPTLWDAILEIVGPHWSPVIAGGAIRDFELGLTPKDIDVFIPAEFDEDLVSVVDQLDPLKAHGKIIWINQEATTGLCDLERLEMAASNDEYSGCGFAPDLIGVWEGEIVGIPVNIIGRRTLEDGAGPLVQSFDFNVLKGYHTVAGYTVKTNEMQADLTARTATLSTSQTYAQSLRRFARFASRNPGVLKLRDPFTKEYEA